MRARRRVLSRIAVAAVAASLLVACAPEEEPSPEPTATATPTPTPEPEPEPIVAPLTGLEVDAEIEHAALAAKIDNHPDAWPQYGIEATDMVVEELVEGGMTRYVAVWHSDVPEQIGPVRSIRPMDPAIITPFGGPVAYSGGQQRFVAAMEATGIPNVIHGGEYDGYFFRTAERFAPHDVILEAERLLEDVDADPPQPQVAFADEDAEPTAVEAGEPATTLEVAFSPSQARTWSCDAESDRWLRAQNGVVDLDGEGAQLDAANVVVLRVEVVDAGGVPETLLTGRSGEGIVASGCSTVPVTWSKAEQGDAIEIVEADGEPVLLTPGNSWVQLVPTTGSAVAS